MLISRLLLVLLFLSIISCGGGKPDDDGGINGGNGEAVAFTRSEDIFQAAEQAFLDTLDTGGTVKDAYTAAADYLLKQPEIDSVQFPQVRQEHSAFIARLNNGLRYSIAYLNNADTQSSKPLTKRPGTHNKITAAKIQSRDSGLPTSKKALLIDSFNSLLAECESQNCPKISDIQEVKKLLEKYDYEVTLKTSTTMDDFKNINNYDIVYIATHGTYYEEDGVSHYALQTDMTREQDLEEGGTIAFTNMLVLAHFTRGFGGTKTVKGRHYALTEQFFAQNTGAFRDDSLVYIDSCNSTARFNDTTAPPLVGVLSGFNMKNYLGWYDSVYSTTAVKVSNYVFSHLLGDTPGSMAFIEEKDPPIRPNGLHAVMLGLEEKNWLVDPKNSYAVFEHMDLNQGSREALLRPSIDGITIDVDITNNEQTLSLTGSFGDRSGGVEVCDSVEQDADNCSSLSVSEWNDDEIVVDLGTDCGSNCTGGVRVVVDNHKSNVHPLTEWKGQITINGQYAAIGPQVNITIDAKFRGEIVDERATAEGDPEGPFGQAAALFGLDSKANYKFSGQFEDANYFYSYEGAGTLDTGASGKQAFTGAVTLKPDEAQAIITSTVVAEAKMTRTPKSPPSVPETQMQPIGITIYHEGASDKYGTISSDNFMQGSLSVSYDEITPSNAPTDNTPR